MNISDGTKVMKDMKVKVMGVEETLCLNFDVKEITCIEVRLRDLIIGCAP